MDKNKKIHFELHMHTPHSDGKNTVEEMATVAHKKNIKIGFSDHGPAHMFFGASNRDIAETAQEIAAYEAKHPAQRLLQGIEGNILGRGKTDVSYVTHPLDYALVGYHKGIFPRSMLSISLFSRSGFNKNRKAILMTDELIAIMNNQQIIAITHPGEYIPIHMAPLAEAAAEYGILLEINERHPCDPDDIALAAEKGAYFLLSTDAHIKSALGTFPRAWQAIDDAAIPTERIVNSVDYLWTNPHLRVHKLQDWALEP